MKFLDANALENIPGRRLGEREAFTFDCRPGLSCFNRCCRNLNLFIYPYDVIRLKKRLAVDSDRFIEERLDIVLRKDNHFPDVLLRMAGDGGCIFLTDAGCAVYSDRPDTCRKFPLEQGILCNPGKGADRPLYFLRPPDFCLGPHEAMVRTPKSWSGGESEIYARMTRKWYELKRLFFEDPWGGEGPEGRRAKMAFMATYNIDRFRDFLLNSSFLKRCRISAADLRKIETDDAALLEFGFDWVRLFLWGIASPRIRFRR